MVGYYTLANGSVSRDEVPPRVAQGLGKYPVPITLLARLAVNVSEKGKGLGRGLLTKGCCSFYERFQFTASPLDELHPYLLIKDIRGVFGW